VISSIDPLAHPFLNNSMLMLNEDYGAKLAIQYLLYAEFIFSLYDSGRNNSL